MAYSNVANGFKTVSADGKLVQAEQTFDEGKGKFQSAINTELQTKVSTLEGKENTLETKVNSLEGSTSALETSVSTLERAVGNKQDKLTAGTNITIENGVISSTAEAIPEEKQAEWNNKQDKLTAGANISISGNTISTIVPTGIEFKGTLGTGGTISTLPTASEDNANHQYKVIVAGTYNGVSANVNDSFTSNGSQWLYSPSNEDSGLVEELGDKVDDLEREVHAETLSETFNPEKQGSRFVYVPKTKLEPGHVISIYNDNVKPLSDVYLGKVIDGAWVSGSGVALRPNNVNILTETMIGDDRNAISVHYGDTSVGIDSFVIKILTGDSIQERVSKIENLGVEKLPSLAKNIYGLAMVDIATPINIDTHNKKITIPNVVRIYCNGTSFRTDTSVEVDAANISYYGVLVCNAVTKEFSAKLNADTDDIIIGIFNFLGYANILCNRYTIDGIDQYTKLADIITELSSVRGSTEDNANAIAGLSKSLKVERYNLLNYAKDIDGYLMSQSGTLQKNGSFGVVPVDVKAGETYYVYYNGVINRLHDSTKRLVDSNGTVITTQGSTIDVPDTLENPVLYVNHYNQTSQNFDDPQYIMVSKRNDLDKHYDCQYFYIGALDDVKFKLKQTTGDSETDAMSQKATTLAIESSKNALQTLIENRIEGLSSIEVEQSVGQSTTKPMSQKAVTDALSEITSGEFRFAPRPEVGYENFFVDVDVNIPSNVDTSTAVQDSKQIMQDRCILRLPINYTRNGEGVRLVICGHGTGWKCTESTATPWAGMNTNLLLAEGYAVLGCNGTPGELDGLDLGHNAVPECYHSVLAAYKYVIEKYNIKRDGVLTAGLSMGCYMTGQVPLFGEIPVLAQVFYGFSGEIWKAQYTYKTAVRQRMTQKFGFVGAVPTFTTSAVPSAAEQQYIKDNISKWSGYNVLLAGLTNKKILELYNVWLASSVLHDNTEEELYKDAIVVGRPPCKFFVCDDDTVAPPRWSEYMAGMIQNGGGYAEVRHYAVGGHNEWSVGDSVSVATKYGGTMSVNGSSYEGLLFLERWDK